MGLGAAAARGVRGCGCDAVRLDGSGIRGAAPLDSAATVGCRSGNSMRGVVAPRRRHWQQRPDRRARMHCCDHPWRRFWSGLPSRRRRASPDARPVFSATSGPSPVLPEFQTPDAEKRPSLTALPLSGAGIQQFAAATPATQLKASIIGLRRALLWVAELATHGRVPKMNSDRTHTFYEKLSGAGL